MAKPKLKLTFGIKNCADCENNIRCEECAYNKMTFDEISEQVRKETVKEVLKPLYEKAEIGTHDENNDFAYVCLQFKSRINAIAKGYGVNLNESNL